MKMKRITLWAKANKTPFSFNRTESAKGKVYGIYVLGNEYEVWHTMQGHETYELHRKDGVILLVTSRSDEIIEYLNKRK